MLKARFNIWQMLLYMLIDNILSSKGRLVILRNQVEGPQGTLKLEPKNIDSCTHVLVLQEDNQQEKQWEMIALCFADKSRQNRHLHVFDKFLLVVFSFTRDHTISDWMLPIFMLLPTDVRLQNFDRTFVCQRIIHAFLNICKYYPL